MAIELLLEQLDDQYVRENFRRLKVFLNELEGKTISEAGSTTIINESVWTKKEVIIPAGNTIAVHSVGLADFRTIQYILSIYSVVEDKTKSMNVLVQHENGEQVRECVWGRIGKSISVNVDTSVGSSVLSLNITNNEAFPLTVELAYLPLG